MGSVQSFETPESWGGRLGKIDAPLNKKLSKVKWGEYRLGDLFEVKSYTKRFDANKVIVSEVGKHPYVVRMSNNNGQKGCIDEDEIYLNEGNTISFGQDTATMFYQERPYFTGDKIKILKAKFKEFNKSNAQFFLTAMAKAFESFSWGSSSFSMDIIKGQIVSLPIKCGTIDFGFISSFIAELEAERIKELEAYLTVSGLKNYELTDEEHKALEDYNSLSFKNYSVPKLFEIKNTRNILSKDIVKNSGEYPYLCASADNNAVSTYISYDKKYMDKGNCIFIGGKTFVVTYQEKDFFSNDSHNLTLRLKDELKRCKDIQLYMATCINKSLGHRYSWGDSISNKKIKNDVISLPSLGEFIDYDSMPILISAIKKLVIRDVVLFADRKIEAAKEIVNK